MTQLNNTPHTLLSANQNFCNLQHSAEADESPQTTNRVTFEAKARWRVKDYTAGLDANHRLVIFHGNLEVGLGYTGRKHITSQNLLPQILRHSTTPVQVKVSTLKGSSLTKQLDILSRFNNQEMLAFFQEVFESNSLDDFALALEKISLTRPSEFKYLLTELTNTDSCRLLTLPKIISSADGWVRTLPTDKQAVLSQAMTAEQKQMVLVKAVSTPKDFDEMVFVEQMSSWEVVALPSDGSERAASHRINESVERQSSDQSTEINSELLLAGLPRWAVMEQTKVLELIEALSEAHPTVVISTYLSLSKAQREEFRSNLPKNILKQLVEYSFGPSVERKQALTLTGDDATHAGESVSLARWQQTLAIAVAQLPSEENIDLFKELNRQLQVTVLNTLDESVRSEYIKCLAPELTPDDIARLLIPDEYCQAFEVDVSKYQLNSEIMDEMIPLLSVPQCTYLFCLCDGSVKEKILSTNELVKQQGVCCLIEEIVNYYVAESRGSNPRLEQVYKLKPFSKYLAQPEFRVFTISLYGSTPHTQALFSELQRQLPSQSHALFQSWVNSELEHFSRIVRYIEPEFFNEYLYLCLSVSLQNLDICSQTVVCLLDVLPKNIARSLCKSRWEQSDKASKDALLTELYKLGQVPSYFPLHCYELSKGMAEKVSEDSTLGNSEERLKALFPTFLTPPIEMAKAANVLSLAQWQSPVVVDYCCRNLSLTQLQELLVAIGEPNVCLAHMKQRDLQTEQTPMHTYIAEHKPELLLQVFSISDARYRASLVGSIPLGLHTGVFVTCAKSRELRKPAIQFLILSPMERKETAFVYLQKEPRKKLLEQIPAFSLTANELKAILAILSSANIPTFKQNLPVQFCHHILDKCREEAMPVIFELYNMPLDKVLHGYNKDEEVSVVEQYLDLRCEGQSAKEDIRKAVLTELCNDPNISDDILVIILGTLSHEARLDAVVKNEVVLKRLDQPRLYVRLAPLFVEQLDLNEIKENSNPYYTQRNIVAGKPELSNFYIRLLLHSEPEIIKYAEKTFSVSRMQKRLAKLPSDPIPDASLKGFSFDFLMCLLAMDFEGNTVLLIPLMFSAMNESEVSENQAKIVTQLISKFKSLNSHKTLNLFCSLPKTLQLKLLELDSDQVVDRVQLLAQENEMNRQFIEMGIQAAREARSVTEVKRVSVAQSFIAMTLRRDEVVKAEDASSEHSQNCIVLARSLEKCDSEVAAKFLSLMEPAVCRNVLTQMDTAYGKDVIAKLRISEGEQRIPFWYASEGGQEVKSSVAKWANEIVANMEDDAETSSVHTNYHLLVETVTNMSDSAVIELIEAEPKIGWVLIQLKFIPFSDAIRDKKFSRELIAKVIASTPESTQNVLLDVNEAGTFITVIPNLPANVIALFANHYKGSPKIFSKLCQACVPHERCELIVSSSLELAGSYINEFGNTIFWIALFDAIDQLSIREFIKSLITNDTHITEFSAFLGDKDINISKLTPLFSTLNQEQVRSILMKVSDVKKKEQIQRML